MSKTALRLLILITAGALAGQASSGLRADAPDLQVQVGPTVAITRSHYRCWFPTIHQFKSGAIMVCLQMAADQIDAEAELSAYCISRDGGKTWSRRYTMGEEASADGAWSEAADSQDRIWWWGNYPEPRHPGDNKSFYAPLAKYSNDGRDVCIQRNITLDFQHGLYPEPVALFDYSFAQPPVADNVEKIQYAFKAWGNIIRGPGGELLSDGYLIAAEDAAQNGSDQHNHHYRNVLIRSDDDGKTWSEFSTIASVPDGNRPAWMGPEGPNEGSLALLPDRRLYAVYRTGSKGMIGNSWSADGGKTWTAPASIGFEGVAPRIHRLRNGMLVLVTGRPGPVVLRFNPDGKGEHWNHPVTLFSGQSTHYTDVAEIAPGRLLVVYDSTPYGWYEIPYADRDSKNTIFGTFVDVTAKTP